jgi:Uncharacterized integral membrane protein
MSDARASESRERRAQEASMVFVYVLIAILGAAAMAFAVQNPDPVTVSFLNSRTVSLPLSLLLLLSAFVGVVFASVSGFAREIEQKFKVRRLEKRIVELSAPVNQTPGVERGPAHHVLPKV